MIRTKRGLDLPLAGGPDPTAVIETKTARQVAILGPDYMGMKPTMAVRVADRVRRGDVLFTDKKCPRVRYTSPASGEVVGIHRGAKRVLLSVVIRVDGDEAVTFPAVPEEDLAALNREQITERLLESGLWTALRQRPFSRVADPDAPPHAIFVTAMDTQPHAPNLALIRQGRVADFRRGVELLTQLTDGTVYVCKAADDRLAALDHPRVRLESFQGPHPAGNVGTHIHFLDPVGRHKKVWHIGQQDVIALARLFTTGTLDTERLVTLAGPGARQPRLIRTQLGAALDEVVEGELADGEQRVISGSVLAGRTAAGALGFLGRYHQQISIVPEDRRRRFLGWLSPGKDLFSLKNVILAPLFKHPQGFPLTTSTQGEVRAIIPSGTFEDLMPLDIMPLFLMRALAVDDVEEAEALGALELDEEDLALCAFACPSKQEFGPLLRRNLTIIEKEG